MLTSNMPIQQSCLDNEEHSLYPRRYTCWILLMINECLALTDKGCWVHCLKTFETYWITQNWASAGMSLALCALNIACLCIILVYEYTILFTYVYITWRMSLFCTHNYNNAQLGYIRGFFLCFLWPVYQDLSTALEDGMRYNRWHLTADCLPPVPMLPYNFTGQPSN